MSKRSKSFFFFELGINHGIRGVRSKSRCLNKNCDYRRGLRMGRRLRELGLRGKNIRVKVEG